MILKITKYVNYVVAKILGIFFVFVTSAVPVLAATSSVGSGLANAPGVNLTIQSLFGIVAGLACWATRFVTVIMVVMIVWYGFQMMASQANVTKFETARKSLGYAVIGMIVILGAYTIIATVGNAIEGVGQGDLSYKSTKYTMFLPLNCGGY